MYCPRCSQQQLSDEVRFCSRCGFRLVAVSQLHGTDGIAYIRAEEKLPLIKPPELRKGAKRTLLSFCILAASFPLMGIIDPHFPLASPFIIGIAFFTFLFSLVQTVYYIFFGESFLPIKNQSFAFNENQPQMNYQTAQSLPFETRSFDTIEFIQPPSITEPTAKLTRNK